MKLLLQILWGWSVLANGAVGIQVGTIQTNNQNIKLMKMNFTSPVWLQSASNVGGVIDWGTTFRITSLEDSNVITFDETVFSVYPDILEYSLNNKDYQKLDVSSSFTLKNGQSIAFRCTSGKINDSGGPMGPTYPMIKSTGSFSVSGDIASAMISSGETMDAFMFTGYFRNSKVIDASELILPTTNLSQECFSGMFSNSTLVYPPKMPIMDLTEGCCSSMFSNCTELLTAPVLPSTIGAKGCYNDMFINCPKINSITCLLSNPGYGFQQWLDGTQPTGTFVKAAGSEWPSGVGGIPEGWTVIEQ